MFSGLAIGIGIAIIFLNNQGATGSSPSILDHYIQQNGLDFVQQDGTSLFLEN